ncbi:MAG: FdtA/QdtA family cupin domain-containing protein [Myxococcota bacterium]
MTIADCQRIEVPEIRDARGSLVVWENAVPFTPKRVFVIHDVQDGAPRGDHAHRECHEVVVPIGGAVDVVVDDGQDRSVVTLEGPHQGLHLTPMNWLLLPHIPPGVALMVLCSHPYDPEDYIRDRTEFDALVGAS